MAPQIHTYHCICTHLLFASTHNFLSLPRRSHQKSSADAALILPLPKDPLSSKHAQRGLPTPEGYTLLLGVEKDTKILIVRKSNNLERRLLYQCSRCKIVIGYEILLEDRLAETDASGAQAEGNIERGSNPFKIMYLLPGGLMSTEFMASSEKITEEDVHIGTEISVFVKP